MKKKKIKSLALNKKSISDLQSRSVSGKGGATGICTSATILLTFVISCFDCSNGHCGSIP